MAAGTTLGPATEGTMYAAPGSDLASSATRMVWLPELPDGGLGSRRDLFRSDQVSPHLVRNWPRTGPNR